MVLSYGLTSISHLTRMPIVPVRVYPVTEPKYLK